MTGCGAEDSGTGDQADSGAGGIEGGATPSGEVVGGGVVPSCDGATDFAATALLNAETGRSTLMGDTTDGSSSADPACRNSNGAPDNTSSFTAPEAGTRVFTTSPITPEFATFDTTLSVLSNCADVDSTLTCDDNSGGESTSRTSVALAAGQTVHLVVDGYLSNAGTYELTAGLATLLADGEACGLDPFITCAPTSQCYEDFARAPTRP